MSGTKLHKVMFCGSIGDKMCLSGVGCGIIYGM